MLRPCWAPGVNPFTYLGHTLSRSYGVSLPSSLERVLPRALEYSSRPPVLVCGTGCLQLKHLRGFSWPDGITDSPIPPKSSKSLSGLGLIKSGFAYSSPYSLRATIPSVTSVNPRRPPFDLLLAGNGILTVFPSTTPFGLVLGPD